VEQTTIGARLADSTGTGIERSASLREDGLAFLAGDGEAARLVRELDWTATPLGHPSQWSAGLRMVVRFMLANRFPLLLWWGPDYIQIYNDAYSPILGTKHPAQAMGKPFRECWHEVYDMLGPLVDTPFNGGPSTWMEDMELIVRRHGFPEESHFTIAYSPVPDDTAPRGIGGVLATVHEITEKVIAERRVKILSELGARVAEAKTDEQACKQAACILSQYPKDVPFALLYLHDEAKHELRLVGTTGIAPDLAGPAALDTATAMAEVPWPLCEALRSETMQMRGGLSALLPAAPPGPWPDPPDAIAVVPIKSNVVYRPAGALVVGISSCIRPDGFYTSFLDLVGAQIATAIANARAYEEERRRAEALAEIDRVKTAFFSNVSHEFRTPLTLMLGPLDDALAAPETAAPLRAQLELAQRNAQRLLKLVNSLLDFARIEAGRIDASFAPVDLAALTADLSSSFRSAMERASLAYDVDCPPLGEPVYVDRDMWEKIVLNLVSNAFKFTLKGGVRLALSREGSDAMLEVTDTGVGVPAHEIPRLFERFHRVKGAESRTHEGSGIGLALVQELVRLHGGRIEATSELDRGTTFRVRIPFGTAHIPHDRIGAAPSLASTTIGAQAYVLEALRWLPDDVGTATATPVAHPEIHGVKRDERFASTFGSRVLLADDNADMRTYIRELLGPLYRVEAVTDGGAGARGDAPRAARPRPLRRDDAEARRLRAAESAARRREPARRSRHPGVRARGRGVADRGLGRRRGRLRRQAFSRARAPRPGRRAAGAHEGAAGNAGDIAPAEKGAREGGPAEERVPGDARARAAQPARADPQCRRAAGADLRVGCAGALGADHRGAPGHASHAAGRRSARHLAHQSGPDRAAPSPRARRQRRGRCVGRRRSPHAAKAAQRYHRSRPRSAIRECRPGTTRAVRGQHLVQRREIHATERRDSRRVAGGRERRSPDHQ